MPEVRLGQPEIKDNYNYYEADGIKIYTVKSLEPKGDEIYIKLNSLFGFKSFQLSGFKVL